MKFNRSLAQCFPQFGVCNSAEEFDGKDKLFLGRVVDARRIPWIDTEDGDSQKGGYDVHCNYRRFQVASERSGS